jgi:hypothetical protein
MSKENKNIILPILKASIEFLDNKEIFFICIILKKNQEKDE